MDLGTKLEFNWKTERMLLCSEGETVSQAWGIHVRLPKDVGDAP